MNERERIELLRGVLASGAATGGGAQALVGIGDDAAVLDLGGTRLAWSVDVAVEDVHFRRGWLTLRQLGFKSAMAALSDLAAMAARPCGVLSSLVLPPELSDDELSELAAGQKEACEALGTQVVGGNLARGAALSITTGVLGVVGPHLLERQGAKPGDRLWAAGPLGLAAAGVAALEGGADRDDPVLAPALAAWRAPQARLDEALAVAAAAHAGIDVSDGLALDAARLCAPTGVEGAGLKVVLDAESILGSDLVAAARRLGQDPLELALHGGEDYALLVAAPAGLEVAGLRSIGHFVPAEPAEAPVWLLADGVAEPVVARGFDHFGSEPE
ncbi:MAG: thiamine-phosphate kinase [Deltaproteobacteria bacterium]|nr:thiamine-phosphate kinase [Deltaproteobacteria bacterium]